MSPWGLRAIIRVHLRPPRCCCISLLLLNFLAAEHDVLWKHHLHYHCTISRWQCHYVSFYETEIITNRCRVQSLGNSYFNQPCRREAKSPGCFFLIAETQMQPKAPSSLPAWPLEYRSPAESVSFLVADHDIGDTNLCSEMKRQRSHIQGASNMPFELHQLTHFFDSIWGKS